MQGLHSKSTAHPNQSPRARPVQARWTSCGGACTPLSRWAGKCAGARRVSLKRLPLPARGLPGMRACRFGFAPVRLANTCRARPETIDLMRQDEGNPDTSRQGGPPGVDAVTSGGAGWSCWPPKVARIYLRTSGSRVFSNLPFCRWRLRGSGANLRFRGIRQAAWSYGAP